MEFIGTFFLVLTIGITASNPSIGQFAPLAIGAVLIAMIYIGGPISNAHYNPAVTLAIYLSKNCDKKDAIFYVTAQLIAAALASYCAIFIAGPTSHTNHANPTPLTQIAASEILFTFALVFVIFNVAFSKQSKGNQYYGLAIGLIVIGGIYTVGDISGGIFNPAVLSSLIIMKLSDLSYLPIYLASQLIGSVLAYKIFKLVDPK